MLGCDSPNDGIIVDGSQRKGVGVGVELESTMKMESENESENDHFCKIEGKVQFFKNDHFSIHSCLTLCHG